eukprot:CAMPEP_0206620410 /NCGR_PEP_ID=MMETSP0325_2-20121206/61586_1 /ASSEMBLY_ACC=CAM_ASM_000347 /TAXON_ID=2866 /ORGANISM="Crypthecodinium cohnii, Strain Seligo" /LENGTH=1243 /DNA_ID=CAMNT_0054143323 /DNA_START=54 /DNA_END=3781 /DNA_ORIENTATION=-
MRQLRLIPSGVQKWHRDTIATSNHAFAYSSTMALHIYRLKDNTLMKMITAHERTITAICWSPEDSNLLATCSVSKKIAIWDLEAEEERFVTKVTDVPVLMDWASTGNRIALALDNGNIILWEYTLQERHTKLLSVPPQGAKVIRWHPRGATKLLVGVSDGSLQIYHMATSKKTSIVGKSKTSKDTVTDAQWDPLSEDYLIVAFNDGTLSLYDASSLQEIHSFEPQAQPIKSIAWAKAQPGNFLTSTDRVGLLKLWNVSQRAPLSQIKVGSTGVNCVKAFPLNPNLFMVSYKNSSVGVCDIGSKSMKFSSSPGHSETIFDVIFHPNDPDVIATASYDGHVKIWRISTSEREKEMYAGPEQLLYGIAFGPGASHICAVSNTGVLFVWKTDTGVQVLRQQNHTAQAYRCEWNCRGKKAPGTGEIATGGADGYACVTDAQTGAILRKFAHPGAVIGVVWHPTQDNILATGCQDGSVRIWNTKEPNDRPQAVLQGHTARVFNVAFHPICPDLLASGSDDQTIRIWNNNPARQGPPEIRHLVGHTHNVRGLLWHNELPFILFSGSWDSTIRTWDVAAGVCIHCCYEHHADVYGLNAHPQRPFFLVSSSRDTTLRFWTHEDIVRPFLLTCLLKPHQMSELLGTPQEAMAVMTAPPGSVVAPKKLFGLQSRSLAEAIQKIPLGNEGPNMEMIKRIVSFFIYRLGLEDFWGLLGTIRGDQAAVVGTSSRVIFHERELVACQKSKALELASTKGGMGIAGKLEDRLLRAAQIMLRVGDIRSYCRFTAQAGHWERAICIAPAVSQKFWADMCNEYIATLSASADIEECAPFWIASGQASRLVDACVERSELDKAFVVAKAEADSLLPAAPQIGGAVSSAAAAASKKEEKEAAARNKFEGVAANLAQLHLDAGEPLQAAMCFLAVSQGELASSLLSRSHEPILAYVTNLLLGLPQDPTDLKLLSGCAERDGRWAVAGDLLRGHPLGETLLLPLMAMRCPDQDLARQWSGFSSEQYREAIASSLEALDFASATLAAVGADEKERAAEIGVDALYAMFQRPDWTITEARMIMEPLECLPLSEMTVKAIANVLACSAYVGLVEAVQLGYHELVYPLAQTLRNIVVHQNLPFPVSMAEVSMLEAAASSAVNTASSLQQLQSLLDSPEFPKQLRPVCEQHMAAITQTQAAGGYPGSVYRGLGKMTGGQLPTCYKKYAKTSVLTNALIKGPPFELEDRKLHVSLVDALSWARVNSYSPLNT